MASWLHATPEILFVLAVLGIPGLIVALCLRLRPWDAVGLSVPLSLGVLAAANEASIHGHVRWGLPIVAGTTVGLAVVCALCVMVGERLPPRARRSGSARTVSAAWTIRQHQVAALATLGAAVVGAIAVARGIGTPHSLNQTFDGAFHVNSINVVAQKHLASPALFSGLSNGDSGGGFYPPTFGAVAGLLVIYPGVNPVDAANITALAMAMLWPLTVSIAVRRFARPTAFGYSIAMVGAVTVGLFPALLLRFGTLWPNALSYLALAPGLVVLVRLFGLDQAEEGAEDPQGRLGWWASLVAAVLALGGLVFAHPGAIFLLFYLAMPVLIWFGWRKFAVGSTAGPRSQLVRAMGTVAVVGLFFVGVVWASYRISTIASVRHQYWPPTETWDQAIGQILLLGSHLSSPNAAMAVLALAGICVAFKSGAGRYLVASYLIIGTLSVLTAAIETPATMRWTGFWYNDPYRLFAALPVVVLPLIALGADALRTRAEDGASRLVDSGVLRWRATYLSIPLASGLVLCLGVLALQAGLGTRKISEVVAQSYAKAPHQLVNPDEAAMFRRLASKIPDDKTIAGDPFTGEILAGVLSGHASIYQTLGYVKNPDRALVATRFASYRTDPAVCAAVKRLNVGVVVTGKHFFMENANRFKWFVGFENMATIPGLTPIDSGGGATAYRVGNCRS